MACFSFILYTWFPLYLLEVSICFIPSGINFFNEPPKKLAVMKNLVLIILLLVGWSVCSFSLLGTAKSTFDDGKSALAQEDTLEYEIVIFDPVFDSWLSRNARPMSFYNLSHLEKWNERLVREWNNFTAHTAYSACGPFPRITYDKDIEYGKEVNYRLFYYFKYMHQKCRLFRSTPGEWK